MLARYAPSPSGHMHLGNARTALLAWLQARAAGGRIALRIEDLDRDRCTPAWEADVRDDLVWLGLAFDVDQQRQSERGALYDEALAALVERGLVYECYCTRAEVREAASAPHGPGGPAYPGTCRTLTAKERAAHGAAGRRAALRLRVEPTTVRFTDVVHGGVAHDLGGSGDFVVRRADGLHAYQLAVVVDDAAVGVTDVLRGDDLLGSTPRQILLQRLLGLPTPRYAHVPLLYAETGERLAKRHASRSLRSLREAGATRLDVWHELLDPIGDVIDQLGATALLSRLWAS
jgi:glutamyl-tRNA synthetase